MEAIGNNIIGGKIKCVHYGEVNFHEGPFYFSNFDVIDSGINFEMDNGYKWHLYFKHSDIFMFGEAFILGEGEFFFTNEEIKEHTKTWEATEHWSPFLNLKIIDFKVDFVDVDSIIPQRCIIQFENGDFITILIAEELNLDYSIPAPLSFVDVNEIYVFFDENVPEFEAVMYAPYSVLEEEKIQLNLPNQNINTSKIIWALLILIILSMCLYLNTM